MSDRRYSRRERKAAAELSRGLALGRAQLLRRIAEGTAGDGAPRRVKGEEPS